MSDIPCLARVIAAAGVLILAAPGSAQLWSALDTQPKPNASKQPKGTVLCLTPGGSKPRPCASAVAGSTLRLDTNLEGPAEIYFVEVGGGGGRTRVPAKPVAGRNGSYLITVPRHLCIGDKPVNYEIQRLMSQYNQAETAKSHDAQSIGFFQMQC